MYGETTTPLQHHNSFFYPLCFSSAIGENKQDGNVSSRRPADGSKNEENSRRLLYREKSQYRNKTLGSQVPFF